MTNLEHLYYWYEHFTKSFMLSRAFSTFTLNQVIANFDAKIKTPGSVRKWTTISTFEGDLVSVKNNLNISNAACIEEQFRKGSSSALNCEGSSPFASSIIFELHSDDGSNFYARVRNNGRYVNLCEKKETTCEWNTFKQYLKGGIVPDPPGVSGRGTLEPRQVLLQ